MNSPSRDDWRNDLREADAVARSAGWRIALWIIAIIVFVAAISWAIWAVKVATSGPRGAGDVTRQKNSGTNRIFAQQHFQEMYHQVLAYDQQLDQAAADKKTYPNDKTYAVNYSGMVKQCIDARNAYDADANKVTQAQWRDTSLPYQIDPTNPATDCRETQK